MNIYLLRHAEAVIPKGAMADEDRPLTSDGIKAMKKGALGMQALKMDLDLVLSSPLVRARQTAEIAAAALGMKDKITGTKNLVPEAHPEALIAEIARHYSDMKNVLVVGHEPHMGRLASWLLTGTTDLPLIFKKGALMALENDSVPCKGGAKLKWFLTLRQMGLCQQQRA